MTKRFSSIRSSVLSFVVATAVLGTTVSEAGAASSGSAVRSVPMEDEPAIASIVQLFYETSDVSMTVWV